MGCNQKRAIKLAEPTRSLTDIDHFGEGRIVTHVNVPCGQCLYCKERRKTQWCFRMEQEAQEAITRYFVTLTYDPQHVPYDKYGNKVLVQADLTKFMKRLRKKHCKEYRIECEVHGLSRKDKIKMFACGEYGSERGRPHYHLMIFNAAWRDIEEAWSIDGKPLGTVDCRWADGNGASAYIMKYMDKHHGKKQDWKKPKEFTTQSEGIGKVYVDKMKDWHLKNLEVSYVVSPQGAMLPMPRYIREKIFEGEPEKKAKQMIYVNEMVEAERCKEIGLVGEAEYTAQIKRLEKIRETKFQRQNKRRIID